MKSSDTATRVTVTAGCALLLAGAAAHLLIGATHLSPLLAASHLAAPLPDTLRAVFILVGWDWIVLAALALTAAYVRSRLRRPVILICGAALAVQTAIMLHFIGWFAGTDVVLAAAILLLLGGWLTPAGDAAHNAVR